ncbi:MAG: NDP-sugar synthase [Chloroflexi bacterium]|nr:NDP-sugar synthase [Chloroflexota bacterium]
MKAVILVGGKATRLHPLTANLPKAMVPVLNTPFLEHVIRHLSRHGITEIVLSLGHLAEPVEAYFKDGSGFGVKLKYVLEDSPRGTAGGIKNVEKLLDGTFIALNGDVFTDLDISVMIDFHRQKKALATIALARADDPTHYGVIETDAESRILSFREKPAAGEATGNMVNIGTYVLEPEALAQIMSRTEVSIERQTFPQLLTQGKPLYAYASSAYWLDIGTPDKYLKLQADIMSPDLSGLDIFNPAQSVRVGQDSNVSPSAQITGPVLIGSGCFIGNRVQLVGPLTIGDGCNISAESVIENSVIWTGAWIGPRVCVKNSIVADHCYFQANSVVEEAVLGDNVTVCEGSHITPGSRIASGTVVERTA